MISGISTHVAQFKPKPKFGEGETVTAPAPQVPAQPPSDMNTMGAMPTMPADPTLPPNTGSNVNFVG
jgi:hypothetical protein